MTSDKFRKTMSAVRIAQVDASLKLARTAALGGVFNACIMLSVFWQKDWMALELSWAAMIAVLSLARMRHSTQWLHRVSNLVDPTWDERAIAVMAGCNGTLWGLCMAFGGYFGSPMQFTLTAMLTGGMMGASVISYGPLPFVAFCYLAPLTASCFVGWLISANSLVSAGCVLIACYAAVLARSILANRDLFVEKVNNELALRETSDTIQLLLNDYEDQSADWLWSTDSVGRIIEPSARFAQASCRSCDVLNGMLLIELFGETPSRAELSTYLKSAKAFRDLVVQITDGEEIRWWRLSARPGADGCVRGVASDITVEKRAEARVSYLANYCGLTDLANRLLFKETMTRAIRRLQSKKAVAVLCLDLDQFKAVNDTLGHPIGDKLLCEVARRIEAAAPDCDIVARLGGDEFAILISNVSSIEALEACANAIILTIAEPCMLDGMQVVTSASIGIATTYDRAADPADLMKQADLALYSAKSNGRNRFAHFEAALSEAAQQRRELEMDMRVALVRSEFVLHYQSFVDLTTLSVAGYEALVRWNHPTRGLILPVDFIPLAEETGLIVQVGEWVIREATAQISRLPVDQRVAVNLSPVQLRGKNLLPTLVSAIAHAGIAPNRLELEITETALMQDSDANIALLRQIRNLGVRIALDDFGTGYSSLNYLRSFPFDKIKIDRCFVESVSHKSESRAIVKAIVDLADKLGMSTTAEGIESLDQLEMLRAKGCREAQGYLFSRPTAMSLAGEQSVLKSVVSSDVLRTNQQTQVRELDNVAERGSVFLHEAQVQDAVMGPIRARRS